MEFLRALPKLKAPKSDLRFAANTSAKTLIEFVYTSTGVHNFLLPGVERVAARTNVNMDVAAAGGLGDDNVATTTSGFHFFVLWMNICLHNFRLKCCRAALPDFRVRHSSVLKRARILAE